MSAHFDQTIQDMGNSLKETSRTIDNCLDTARCGSIGKKRKTLEDKKYNILKEVLDGIEEQYNDINNECKSNHSACDEIREFEINKMLLDSPFTSSGDTTFLLQRFQICMHYLAKDWDEWVNSKRSPKEYGYHRFMLTYYSDSKTEKDRYCARIYNRKLDPDRRLVSITVPKSDAYFDYTPSLHKIDNYIGRRIRL